MTADRYVARARVPNTVPTGEFGPWTIRRIEATGETHQALCGWHTHTVLYRHTWETLNRAHGEIVMEDSRRELRQHLPIWLHAHGRVLVTGLGLGCVVRGLLENPRVKNIDVIEIDAKIIETIGPEFANDQRVTIIHANALTYPIGPKRWNCAWHDLWCDSTTGAPHLQVMHAQVLARFRHACDAQGAWKLPRFVRRIAPDLATVY